MRNHGNIEIFFITFIFIACCSIAWAQEANTYWLCSYVNNYTDSSNIQLQKFDLDRKQIVTSIRVPLRGEIDPKTPLLLKRDNHKYMVILTVNGVIGKNTNLLGNWVTYYLVYDIMGNQLGVDSLLGMHLFDFSTSSGESIKLTCVDRTRRGEPVLKAYMTMDSNAKITLTFNGEEDDIIGPTIGRFKHYQRLFSNNNRFFSHLDREGLYLLSLNTGNNALLDSMKIDDSFKRSYLFGLSENDSNIYLFQLNYNELGGPSSLNKSEMDSSYLKILNAQTFDLMDSVHIHNPPLELGYTFGEIGTCDKVGPYLVYYFFKGEDYRYYSPAMLFIFDTRTNQASWLRVGWR
jgi:hypothetical protein